MYKTTDAKILAICLCFMGTMIHMKHPHGTHLHAFPAPITEDSIDIYLHQECGGGADLQEFRLMYVSSE